MQMNKWFLMLLTGAFLAQGVVACGGDDDDDDVIKIDGSVAGSSGSGNEGGAGSGGSGNEGGAGSGGSGNEGGAGSAGSGNEGGAGSGGAGNEGGAGSGGEGDVCNARIAQFQECDPTADCCDRNLVCAPTAEGASVPGYCLPKCTVAPTENNTSAVECADPKSVCMPLDGNWVRNADGFCMEGDECVPGKEAEVCEALYGAGTYTCNILLEPATFCVNAGTVGKGESCARNNCQSGLVCMYGGKDSSGQGIYTCEESCVDGECSDKAQACHHVSGHFGGVNVTYCDIASECDYTTNEGCEAGTYCDIANIDDDTVYQLCYETNQPFGKGVTNDPCTPFTNSNEEWGTCAAGHFCGKFGTVEGDHNVCSGYCTLTNTVNCINNSVCYTPLYTNEMLADWGLCVGNCDLMAKENPCEEGSKCQFFWNWGPDNQGHTGAPLAFCQAYTGTLASIGESCDLDDNNCEPGAICMAMYETDTTGTCIELCWANDEVDTCAAGTRCVAPLSTYSVDFGICVSDE